MVDIAYYAPDRNVAVTRTARAVIIPDVGPRILLPLCLLALAAGPLASTLPVSIEVRARAVSPGEPVRIQVVSDEPLETVEGDFLGRTVHMVRVGHGADGRELWSGWSMVDLDQEPGPVAVEVRGTSAGGRAIVGTRAVTVEPKSFPVENLSVAPKYVEPPPEVQERLARERKKLAEIYRRRSPRLPATEPFVRPVDGEPTSAFGTKRLFNGQPRSPHSGLDLRAGLGTTVRASGAGRVALAEDLYYSGKTVLLDHGGGLFTIYAHLSEIRVAEGTETEAGGLIGLSGATGRVTGPHLHWGAKVADRPFDPLALLDPSLFR